MYNIVLCGPYGCGKTTIATALSEITGGTLINEPVESSQNGIGYVESVSIPRWASMGGDRMSKMEYAKKLFEFYSSRSLNMPALVRAPTAKTSSSQFTKALNLKKIEGHADRLRDKTHEIISRLPDDLKQKMNIRIWDGDFLTLSIGCPVNILNLDDLVEFENYVHERSLELKRVGHPHPSEYRVSCIPSDDNTLERILCIVKRDLERGETGRYVYLDITPHNIMERIEKRGRMGDNIIRSTTDCIIPTMERNIKYLLRISANDCDMSDE